jgi:hypothetical protein
LGSANSCPHSGNKFIFTEGIKLTTTALSAIIIT